MIGSVIEVHGRLARTQPLGAKKMGTTHPTTSRRTK
jgi:hypothetical protein